MYAGIKNRSLSVYKDHTISIVVGCGASWFELEHLTSQGCLIALA